MVSRTDYPSQTKEYKSAYMRQWRKDNPERFKAQHNTYYANNREHINMLRRKNPYSLLSILKRNAKKRDIFFGITREEFEIWWNSQKQECVYCSVPVERLIVVDKKRQLAKRLSIDRIVNERGYTIDNIALCCLRCNFVKLNIFSFDEMKEIGQNYLKPKWQNSN